MIYVDLDQRTPEWLSWRFMGITATESAVILGQSPYKTPWRLWSEKTGRLVPADLSNNPLVRQGQLFEDAARRAFEFKHAEVLFPECAEYSAEPLFRASFDGLTADEEPVEIKCPGEKVLSDVKALGRDSAAFRLYNIQVQHQLLVAGAEHGWLVFFDCKTGELTEFEIFSDEALIAEILKAGRAFWKTVTDDVEPQKDAARDFFVPKTKEEILKWSHLAADYISASSEVEHLKAQIERLNTERNRCKEGLTSMMGEFRFADCAGVALTRRMATGTVDYEKLCKAKGISSEDLAAFRKKPKESWLIRTTVRDNQTAPSSGVPMSL